MRENEKESKLKQKHPKLSTILDIVFVIIGVVSLAVAGVLFYQRVYLSTFFVNGQSMYPTLNSETKDPYGNYFGATGHGLYDGVSGVDFGVMDTHKIALNHLKRFDIVVTKFPKRSESESFIKRIIGLPGETISFTSTNRNDPANGDLYVGIGDNKTLVPQPIDNQYKCNVDENNSLLKYPTEPITLGENEYFLLGDNRGNSSDSREQGKIHRDLLIGKVIAIVGRCEIKNGEPTNIKYYKWPEKIK